MTAHPLASIARYGLIGVIWTGLMLMIVALSQSSAMGNTSFVFAAVIGATIVSLALLRTGDGRPAFASREFEASKRKHEPHGADPLNLLTDEDVAELRAEYKDMLRRRMLRDANDAGEGESFESLLAEREHYRR